MSISVALGCRAAFMKMSLLQFMVVSNSKLKSCEPQRAAGLLGGDDEDEVEQD